MRQRSEQENFWSDKFGTDYTERNENDDKNNMAFWRTIFAGDYRFESVIEFGANRGSNIKCLKKIYPLAEFSALEINEYAANKLREIPDVNVFEGSMFDFYSPYQRDLVFTKGVLIHIAPELLPQAYKIMFNASSRYIFIAEYYSPKPVMIPYRGNDNRLFKRDFAGEMMAAYPLKLVDYGFWYHLDPHPQDDINWFMMEKV